jgi:pimeloyl-ACP methyl ester carboxylesterase
VSPARGSGLPQVPADPLVLKARGSFYVGGERVQQSEVDAGRPGLPGHVVVNQMYVEYMVPCPDAGRVPVVMVHGTSKSGKTYDTTPDGRMGWYEYFVRRGHPAYLVDQVGRGRSGFNQAAINQVRAGNRPAGALPNISRFNEEFAWASFRIGPSFGVPFADTRFPVDAMFELAQQNIPDLNSGLPAPNPTWKALSDLAIRLEGAVLLGHSQSGAFPLDAALADPAGVKGAVIVEPGANGCKSTVYTEAEISILGRIPTLVVFGDHLDADTGQPHAPRLWRQSFDDSLRYIDRVNAAGGRASMLHLPGVGIRGNSHLLMQDTNNLEIADRILAWIGANITAN